jgi:glycosyltransferase involved in cell wall biosynthesis
MSAPPPMFSVVTCCYNQGPFLATCIESVLKQRYPSFEHIVVDDGSTDDTAAVCARFPHVRYIRQANAGQSAALNRGFLEAKGDIIAWCNSDDYYEPHAFHTVARELDPARGRWIVAGAAKVVDAKGQFMWMLPNGNVPFFRLLFHHRLFNHNGWMVMPCQPSVFFHRTVREQIGLLDTTLKYGMDYEYWLRALRAGFRLHYIPQIFSDYCYHATSNSNQGWDKFYPEWKAVSDRHYAALPRAVQRRAERWWRYARLESIFVKADKCAYQHYLQRVGWQPHLHPLHKRLLVLARAMLIAPWVPLTLLVRPAIERRLFARAAALDRAAA